eukprot:1526612-Prymnesium_polylepis.1
MPQASETAGLAACEQAAQSATPPLALRAAAVVALALPTSVGLWCTIQAVEGVLNTLSAPHRPRPL